MSAESMNKQEQLHIKDNETLELEQTANVTMESSQVDLLSDISSKSVENNESYMEVVPTCLQISTDSHDDEVPCQSGEQVSQSLNKSMESDIDSKVSDAAEIKSDTDLEKVDTFYSSNTCNDSSKSEQKDENKKIDDLSYKDDELFVEKNLIIETSICKDMSESLKSDQATELSDDYLTQMMKNVNDREMAIYEGAFLSSDGTDYSQHHLDNAEKRSLLPDIESNTDLEKVDTSYFTNTCSDSSKNERKDENKNIDDLSYKDDELFVDKNLIIEKGICKDMSESLKSDQATELSDDYLTQMMKNVNEKEMAIYEGTFLLSDETEYSQDHLDNLNYLSSKEQSLLPEQEALVINVLDKAENNEPLNETEIVVEANCDSKENVHAVEKLMTIDNTFVEEIDKYIDKNNVNNHDMLPSEKLLLIDKSNSPNDDKETENNSSYKSIDELESLAADTNEHQSTDGKIPLHKIESIDLKRAVSQCNLKDTSITLKSSELIDKIQNMDWLKPGRVTVMEMNRRKSARKSSIEKECTEVVKEEFTEDVKSNPRSAKRRSSQSKNRKAKTADFFKQDSTEDQYKKSSSDVQLANTSKNETSKSANVQAVEKSKDTQGSPQILGSQKISIGRGRNDRRKISLGNSQPKGQSDISDQRNQFPLDIPIMEENNSSKDEAHAQDSLCKIIQVEDFTEYKVVADSTKSKKTEICETEIDSRLNDGTGFSHDQSSVQSTAKWNEPSTQKNEEKIDVQKNQLLSVSDDQESQNKSGINWPIRPIFGRLSDENKSEKVPFPVRGFGQKTNEIIEKSNQPFQSQNFSNEDNFNKIPQQFNKNPNYSKYSENKSHQSFNRQDYHFNKNTSFNNPSNDLPRWNHDKQNIKSNEFTMQKGFTSNRHRNVADENKKNEEPFSSNQMFTDKCQVSKGFSDKSHDSRTYGNRYNERNQDNRNVHYQYSDKKHDHRNYGEWNSVKNHQESKLYNDIVSDRNQGSQGGDRYSGNQNNRGFGDRFSDRDQDKAFGDRCSDKARDSKSSGNRYTDKNPQSKTFSERFYDRSHDGNQTVTKKEEPSNKYHVSFDKNENRSNKSQIVTKSLDSSSKNQILSNKNDHLNQAESQEFSNRHQVHFDKYQENRNSNDKSPNSTKEPFSKTQICPKTEDTNENNSRKNQVISNNSGDSTNEHHLSQYQHPHEIIDKFTNNFWQAPEQEDWNKVRQDKSDVKSQKHYDNTQQVKVQKGSNQLQQSCSVPSVAHQQEELPPTIDQNTELHKKVAHSTDLANIQPTQSMDWNSYNTSKQDAVHAIELESVSPYVNANVAMNPAVVNEYKLQYNQTHLNASNQCNSDTTSFEQRPNLVMTFEGNQNIQRALGMDPGTLNQSQPCQMNNNDPSQFNTNIPAPSQQVYTNANVTQFFQSLAPAIANSQTTLAYSHSTMNVNAPPFEVPKQFNQESNNQLINDVQSKVSNSHTAAFLLGNGCAVDPVRLNKISNCSEECLKLYLEVHELSKQLSLKQAQLITSQMKLFNAAAEDDRTTLNQPTSPPTQPISNKQLVQEQNQPLPSDCVQIKHPNYPPGFGEVSLNVQSTQMNLYEMSTNVANVQNYAVEKLSSNSVSEPRINAQPRYLAQGNLYQQQAANYQVFTDKTANSATYINMIPQTDEQKKIRSSATQYSKQ